MEGDFIKRVSEYLRRGAKLTSENCPICSSPLIETDGKYYCVKCEREVIFASSREELIELSSRMALFKLEEVISRRISDLSEKLINGDEERVLGLLDKYLSILERITRIAGREAGEKKS